jgi:hypothetical protein
VRKVLRRVFIRSRTSAGRGSVEGAQKGDFGCYNRHPNPHPNNFMDADLDAASKPASSIQVPYKPLKRKTSKPASRHPGKKWSYGIHVCPMPVGQTLGCETVSRRFGCQAIRRASPDLHPQGPTDRQRWRVRCPCAYGRVNSGLRGSPCLDRFTRAESAPAPTPRLPSPYCSRSFARASIRCW